MAGHDDRVSGVRGWLLLFVANLALLQPLLVVYAMLVRLGAASETTLAAALGWATYVGAERVIFILIPATAWLLTARLLIVRNWTSIRIALGGIWAMNLGIILLQHIVRVVTLDTSIGDEVTDAVPALLYTAIFCIPWTIYLRRSARVANTYRRDAEGDRLADVFD